MHVMEVIGAWLLVNSRGYNHELCVLEPQYM